MIDERHLDELLREAGEELDRLSDDHHVARGESVPARREHGRWFPILAAGAAVAIGVTGVILVRQERASAPGNGADVSVSAATTQPTAPVGPVVHVVVQGDFLSGIADEYGVPVDAIVELNEWPEGLNHALIPGEEVLIPVTGDAPAATTMAPAPVTTASLDPATLPHLMLADPPDGYTATQSFSGGYGKDFEPPAYLLGWRMADAEEVYVPVVLSWQSWPGAALPGARHVDTEAVTGWIATLAGATVGVFDVDGMPVHVRAASTAVPDEDLVALAATAPAATELEFVPPESFVELARQTADAAGNFTSYTTPDGGELSFGTLSAMPLNGLTIGTDATATHVTVRGAPAIVISGATADGATGLSLFWGGADNVVRFLATADQGTNLTVDDLITLAEHTRSATPVEIDRFEEI